MFDKEYFLYGYVKLLLILDGEYSTIADLNEDGVVNILDIIIYVNIILST